MPSADCCAGVRAACARAQSIAVARPFPGRDAALPGYDREWVLHKRDIYPLPRFRDFAVSCPLVPGTCAGSVVRVPRLAVRSPASFRPPRAVTPLPWTGSDPQVSCDS